MPVIGPSCTAQEHHTIMAYLRALEAQNISYDAGYLNDIQDIHITDIFDNFFNDPNNIDTIELSNVELGLYHCNPKQLCIDLYGTHDYMQIIMQLNEVDHPGEFTLEKGYVKVPNPSFFATYINTIYTFRKQEFSTTFKNF